MDPQQIIRLCEANWDAHKFDCSGFVKAVANALRVTTFTPGDNANDLVDKLHAADDWIALAPGDGAAAKAQADGGSLVIAGMKGADQTFPDQHGHVVVVVTGPLDSGHHAYPMAYWGSLAGNPQKHMPINFAWRATDRDRVAYFAKHLNA
jgi:hypothetical protein